MTIQRIERELRSAIELAIARGFRLTFGRWGVMFLPLSGQFLEESDRCGCALAAWAIVKQPLVPTPQWAGDLVPSNEWIPLRLGAATSEEFGWSTSEFRAFTDAWDGDVAPELAEAHPEIGDLAQRLVDEYLQPEMRGAA